MLIYDPVAESNAIDYGILVPLEKSRARMILDYLQETGSRLPVYDFAAAAKIAGTATMSRADLERVHAPEYIARLYNEGDDNHALEKEILSAWELVNADGAYNRYAPERAVKPLCGMFESALNTALGDYLCCRAALAPPSAAAPIKNFCFYLGGGSHHARYDAGSGFCILNDIIIAARKVQDEGAAGLIWIIDVDAHKGDGSAELVRFSRERGETFIGKNPEIITLSVHMASGWPLDADSLARAEAGRAPLVPSDIDIPLVAGEEAFYLNRLAAGLAKMAGRSGGRRPDLAIVVDGVDVYEKDGLASSAPLSLSLEQCLARDNFLFTRLQESGIPSAWIMAGGYGEAAWEPTAKFLAGLPALTSAAR
jgi:acetoin utilization deacetylase AcuC-like enzyme